MAEVANCISLVTTAIDVLEPGDARFPERLVALGWRRRLHVRGTLNAGPAVAIVGARAASRAGLDRAHALARHLAGRGIHVVSGGAIGVDGAAHRGALAGGGTTSVVLGSGVDVAYPARHAGLFEEVVARGGALLSLLPPGTSPRRTTFTQRNPLISALADVVVVVEAAARSGSLTTAAAATTQRRIVAAYPGSPGCARLLAAGAALIEHPEDALAALAGAPRHAPAEPVDPTVARVAAAIADGACGVDAIVAATGLSVRAVLRALPGLPLSSARCS